MKKLALLFILIFVVACGTTQETKTITIGDPIQRESVCNKPYYEYKAGECCLDKDANKVCDADEVTEEIVEEIIVEEPEEKPKEIVSEKVEDCSDFCAGRADFDSCFDVCSITCGSTVRLSNLPGDYACDVDGAGAKVRIREIPIWCLRLKRSLLDR